MPVRLSKAGDGNRFATEQPVRSGGLAPPVVDITPEGGGVYFAAEHARPQRHGQHLTGVRLRPDVMRPSPQPDPSPDAPVTWSHPSPNANPKTHRP